MFEHKEYLTLLSIIPILIVFYIFYYRKFKKNIYEFIEYNLLIQVSKINIKIYLMKISFLILSIFFLIIALADPKYGSKISFVSKKASTIVLVLDVSKSMLAQDLKPNRLERAKSVLSNLIAGIKDNKIGIIAFAGTSQWVCPITFDTISANNFLSFLTVDVVPLGGTKIAKALDLALDGTADIPEGAKAIILVTDGEDDDSGLHILIEKAQKYKTKIYTIGIGQKDGSKIIYNSEYVRDKNGDFAITKLDEKTLQYIADSTDGKYINLSEDDDSIVEILNIVDSLDKAKDENSKEIKRDEKYQSFLLISMFLFCIYLLLSMLRTKEDNQ